ncbi:MAG TPA: DMT family transporter [Methylomirabilota bacterium]|nr:DMT family transporter [Methylomirabilota bacterium]
MTPTRAAGVMCLTMLIWPVVELVAKFLLRPYSPFQIVWMRYGTHLLLMVVLWAPGGAGRLVRTRRPGLHIVRGLMMLGMPAFFVFSRIGLSLDASLSLFWIAPLLAMMLGVLLLGERVRAWQWLVVTIAYLGVLVALGPFAVTRSWAGIFSLLMAGCFAAYLVLTRYMRDESAASRLFYTALVVWASLCPFVPSFWRTPSVADLAIMVSIGILGFFFLLGLDKALDAAPAAWVAPFTLVTPIWTVAIDVALRGQPLMRHTIAGMVVLLGAGLVLLWSGRAPLRRPAGAGR